MDPGQFPSAEAYAEAVRRRKGQYLRRLREARGLSRLMLQRISRVTDETIRRIELGVANPSSDIVSTLCFALGVRVEDFTNAALSDDEPPPPPPPAISEGAALPIIIG